MDCRIFCEAFVEELDDDDDAMVLFASRRLDGSANPTTLVACR
jgi:hypothetical protein